jgi:ADP-ribosylglycohydrolase
VEPSPAADPAALPLPNSYWVLPGTLLAGEYPGGSSAEATRERLARLLALGVNTFVDLTQAGELPAYDYALPQGVQYLRKPIRDHGLPREPSVMGEILDAIASAHAAGRVVYLHCRAGIGRTGTVAGCLLAERGGTSGVAALATLNRLWKQSQRSALWPSVPETEEQADYVRDWVRHGVEHDPLLEPATLAAASGLRARFQGALLGLAAGDAVGVATQFARPGRFATVGDMLGGGPFDLPRGAWSDDTAMALCLAESLLERGFDARDQVDRYRLWQQEGHLSATGQCVGITAGAARAIALAQWRRQAYSGSHDPDAQDPAVLSRVPAVVLYYFAQAQQAAEQAAEAARTTCQAAPVLACCRAFARALHAALSGAPRAEVLGHGREVLLPLSGDAINANSALSALAVALDAFERTQSFRDAVLYAANQGGNSDVVGACCGALAGAYYTASAIPTMWRNSLMKLQLLEEFADRLLAHAMLELATDAE